MFIQGYLLPVLLNASNRPVPVGLADLEYPCGTPNGQMNMPISAHQAPIKSGHTGSMAANATGRLPIVAAIWEATTARSPRIRTITYTTFAKIAGNGIFKGRWHQSGSGLAQGWL